MKNSRSLNCFATSRRQVHQNSYILLLPYARHYSPWFVYIPFLKAKNFFSRIFFVKFWTCMVSIQEQFQIKSGLSWRAYGNWFCFSAYPPSRHFNHWENFRKCSCSKKLHKKLLQINFSLHFSLFQDFQNQILFQYSKLSYNIKVNFSELSDILRFIFFNIFLDVGGPSIFSKVHQAMSLTLVVSKNTAD